MRDYQNMEQRHDVRNIAGKIVPIDLPDEELLQTFNLWKTQYMWNTINEIKWDLPIKAWKTVTTKKSLRKYGY